MRDMLATNVVTVEPSLESLMAAYTGGDSEAFRELHRRLAPKLYSYLLRLSRDAAMAPRGSAAGAAESGR